MADLLTSNEVAALTGISLRQLQWWDERGLVVPARQGHRRLYSLDDLAEVAVIGDMSNDLPMFKVAGFAVAMGNASEEVKASADFITASNAEDGFARAVSQCILPRGPRHGGTL